MLALSFSKKTLAVVAFAAASALVLLFAVNTGAQCDDCDDLSASAAAGPCVPANQKTGVITVSIKNSQLQRPYDGIAVSLNGNVIKTVDAPASSTVEVKFDGLAAGEYTVKSKYFNRLDFEDKVTLEECPAEGRGAVESAVAPAASALAAEQLPVSGPETAVQLIAAALAGGSAFAIARKRL